MLTAFAERMSALEERVKNTQDSVTRIERKLDDFILGADHRFASKWVEQVITFASGAIVLGFFGGLFFWLFGHR